MQTEVLVALALIDDLDAPRADVLCRMLIANPALVAAIVSVGFPLEKIKDLVSLVPSVFPAIDHILTVVEERPVFAFVLCSQLCKAYALQSSLVVAKRVLHILMSKINGHSLHFPLDDPVVSEAIDQLRDSMPDLTLDIGHMINQATRNNLGLPMR
jgi:hypothetical protein